MENVPDTFIFPLFFPFIFPDTFIFPYFSPLFFLYFSPDTFIFPEVRRQKRGDKF